MKYDIHFLRITRRLSFSQPIELSSSMGVSQQQTRDDVVEHLEAAAADKTPRSAADFDLEVSDDDDDLVLPRTQPATTILHYDILHSPTYRAPLLYLTPSPPITLPTLFRTVLPRTYAPQIRAFGPLGAVTLTDHPARGGVAYLVHPCRTGEAMAGTDESGDSRGLGYLMRWIGIVGVGLGLSVPLGMAEALVSRSVGVGTL